MAKIEDYDTYRENFLKLRYDEDPTVVIREIVELAREAAGGRPLTAVPFTR